MFEKVSTGKRVLAMILAMVMIMSMIPASAFSASDSMHGEISAIEVDKSQVTEENGVDVLTVQEDTIIYQKGGAPYEAYWVGAQIEAPSGRTAGAQLRVKSALGAAWGEWQAYVPDRGEILEFWMGLTEDAVISGARNGNDPIRCYEFDWDGDGTADQTVHFVVELSDKIVLKNGENTVFPKAAMYGTLTPLTGTGELNTSDPKNLSYTLTDATLDWVEANALRNEGWWAGVFVEAPAGLVVENAYYRTKSGPNVEWTVKSYKENNDGNGIQLWMPTSGAIQESFVEKGRDATFWYEFDWNGDGLYEQAVTFAVSRTGNILYYKNGAQYHPVPELTANLSASEAVAVVDGKHYYSSAKPLTLTVEVPAASVNPNYPVKGVTGSATVGGTPVALTFTADGNKYVCTYSGADATLQNILVTVDFGVKQVDLALNGEYVYDTTAPTLELTVTATGKTAAMAADGSGNVFIGVTEPSDSAVAFEIKGTVADANCSMTFSKTVVCQPGKLMEQLLEDTVVDLAGNKLQSVTLKVSDEQKITFECDENGKFSKKVIADLQKPYSDDQTLNITVTDGNGELISNKIYTEDELTFRAYITDGEGVGIGSVQYYIGENATAKQDATWNAAEGVYEFPMKDLVGEKEGTVVLTVIATDKLNNENSVATAAFTVDTITPKATITAPAAQAFYTEKQVITVTVEGEFDPNATLVSYTLNGAAASAITWNGNVGTIEVENGQTFSGLKVTPVDAVGHVGTQAVSDSAFCVDTEAPSVSVTKKGKYGTTANGTDFYSGNFVEYTFTVSDVNLDVAAVTYTIDGVEETMTSKRGVITVSVRPGQTLTAMSVVATDKAGNSATTLTPPSTTNSSSFTGMTYTGNAVCVDNTAPVVTLTKTFADETAQEVDGTKYYAGNISYVFGLDEVNVNTATVTYKLEGKSAVTENLPFTLELKDGETLQRITVKAMDHAKNYAKSILVPSAEDPTQLVEATEFAYNSGNYTLVYQDSICVDTTAPVVSVVKETEGVGITDDVNHVAYSNAPVKYTFAAADTNLQSATLTYTVNGAASTVDITEGYVLTVENGQTLEAMSIASADKAGNPAVIQSVENFNGLVYAGDQVCVDTVDPVVTVEKTVEAGAELMQDVNGVEYYNGEVTYTFTVTEAHLYEAKISYTLQNGQALAVTPDAEGKMVVTVPAGDMLTDMTVYAKDYATNRAQSVGGNEPFVFEDFELKLSKNAVVDKTAPTAVLNLEGNIKNEFYVDGEVIYVKMKTPVTGNSGEAATGEETITLTVTVSDKNLTLDKNATYRVIGDIADEAWTDNAKVNEDGTLVYTKTLTVAADATGILPVRLTVVDMAGNPLTDDGLTVLVNGNASTELKEQVVVTDGAIGENLVSDRLRPTSEDGAAPVIVVTPDTTNMDTTGEGLDLFCDTFNFMLTVSDGSKADYNAGLAWVEWKITDENGIVLESGKKIDYAAGTYTDGAIQIPVQLSKVGKSEVVKLVVTAADNVGNTVTYEKVFAMDNSAPSVTVVKSVAEGTTCNSCSAANVTVDMYNGKVTYTVTVSDRNPGEKPVVNYELGKTTKEGTNQHCSVTLEWNDETKQFEGKVVLDNGDILKKLEIVAIDAAGNAATEVTSEEKFNGVTYAGNQVAVDMTPAAVTVEKTTANATKRATYTENGQSIDLYNGNVTYTVTVTDAYMTKNGGSAMVYYTLEGETEARSFSVLSTNVGGILNSVQDKHTASFKLENGQVLTGLWVEVTDNAGNKTTTVATTESFDGTTYNGNLVAVDTTPATVNVKKVVAGDTVCKTVSETDGETTRTIDMYSGNVTYQFEVKDAFLGNSANTISASAKVYYTLEGEADEKVVTLTGNGQITSKDEDTFTGEFTLENGQVLTSMRVEVTDNAGNKTTTVTSDESFNGTTYNGNLVGVDGTPATVTVTKTTEATKQNTVTAAEGSIDMYNDEVTYTVKVSDLFLTSGTGTAVLYYTLEGEAEVEVDLLKHGDGSAPSNNEDTYEFSFTLTDGQVLTGMRLVVKDNVGNETTELTEGSEPFTHGNTGLVYAGNLVAVDMTAPAVSVVKTTEATLNTVSARGGTIDLYNGEVTYTVKVSDQFLTSGTGTAVLYYTLEGESEQVVDLLGKGNGNPLSHDKDTYEFSFTLTDGQVLTAMRVVVKDNVDNASKQMETGSEPFTWDANQGFIYGGNLVGVDMTAPTVSVSKSSQYTNKQTIQEGTETVDLFNSTVTYTVTVTDQFLTNDSAKGTAILYYTMEGEEQKVVDLFGYGAGNALSHDNDTYTVTFEVKDNQVLTGMRLVFVDNAGNQTVEVTEDSEPFGYVMTYAADGTEEAKLIYTGNLVAVDQQVALVTVTRDDQNYVQTFNNRDYFEGTATYTITVTDEFLTDATGKAMLYYTTETDGVATDHQVDLLAESTTESEPSVLSHNDDTYTYQLKIEDGQMLTGMWIDIVDNIGHKTTAVEAASNVAFAQDEDDNKLKYTGIDVIVDTTRPTATVNISGDEVQGFYTHGNVTYVMLNSADNGLSGEPSKQVDPTEVLLTVTVNDRNLSLNADKNIVISNLTDGTDVWEDAALVNHKDGTVTYKKVFTVDPDSVGTMSFEMLVVDLAGNEIEKVALDGINDTDSTNITEQVQPDADGVFGTTISLDRRRPGTEFKPVNIPEIIITPMRNGEELIPTESNAGCELFDGEFYFDMDVKDKEPEDPENENAGLDYITWQIVDEGGYLKTEDNEGQTEYLSGGTYEHNYDVNVVLPRNAETNALILGESNQVTLKITVYDKVGNYTEYFRTFAVDTLAPRVTVSYDNNDVRNDKYFKANRIATVTVTDINFNADTTPIDTQVTGSGWSRNGDTYTNVFVYANDGDYTFNMSATDKANNKSSIDFTNGGKNAAPQDFTVDKTAPVMVVTYNPENPVDRDGQGVEYFDRNREMTVQITEVNFDPAIDLTVDLGEKNTLSPWTTGENYVRTASTTFTEGNNYSVSMKYIDLAGNEAEPYTSETFSVDTHLPTITVTTGDMTNEGLNIVQNDLVLGFTINDTESNLKNFTVEVLHLDNKFEQEAVSGVDYYTISGATDRTTGYVDFTNIAKTKANDGIYTVRITALDYAGHQVELAPELMFSLNRFGSSFTTNDDYTKEFLTPDLTGVAYREEITGDLLITEINPNRVYQDADTKEEGSQITILVNGKSMVLEKGKQYDLTVEQKGAGGNLWYAYTYKIFATNFTSDGEVIDGKYAILFFSEDEAGNKNTNEANTGSNTQLDSKGQYTGKVEFTLDHKAPVVSVAGIESGEQYYESYRRVQISITDNTPHELRVYVGGKPLDLKTSMAGLQDGQDWLAYDKETGNYVLNLASNNRRRDIRVVVLDAAGNETVVLRDRVQVTQNIISLYFSNFLYIAITVLAIAAIILLVILLKRRKKN